MMVVEERMEEIHGQGIDGINCSEAAKMKCCFVVMVKVEERPFNSWVLESLPLIMFFGC